MKKFKNAPIKVEPVKSEPAKAEPTKVVAAKPELPKVGRVSFELVKPGARQVYVAGSFNDWKPEKAPLMPKGNGRWVGDLTIKPGRHEYLFVVDGQWLADPNAKESVQNPYGGRNSILGVSE
jgi:1,4-alpha-glucan branching enzyme